ncbi:macrophage mannose receptor 1-like isoform X12 [Astyanax mexicanus]|uniref:macrophage mannose receptor 1-like isoform X12 n=1 Tax=Astyanax mexicanus TaxID=7994 RepID=UPI0020CB338C|nr:macrophage mannose receptor 1-like isoform X12 [Astyanax mexicanus]XP_049338835.1 macrophage mannose receptor 1-like isoform X12 [Astyanax mexicanus]XP_049338836.1 macrophage mannose receptor 1-like isoform X12 [Astyanax mexicanus]XP_049338837.1 macrophage mannose receptor 1-like isoform X12 [Astyanax mexicanus]
MRSALHCLLLFSALWTLSFCGTLQFYLVNERKNWTEAQKYCREKYTDLATIENQEEMDAVKSAVNGSSDYVWIGLRLNPKVNPISWIWSDGSNFSYSNWVHGQPNNHVGDNCVQLRTEYGYGWDDVFCYSPFQFICYKEQVSALVLIKEKKTWWEALRYCRENHVDLVSVHTEGIQRWVETVARNASTDNVWVGLRHTCAQGFWFWVSGSTICYQNWAPGNGTGVEDCSNGERSGAVQSGSKQWISLLENQTLNFICTESDDLWVKIQARH